MAQRSKIINVSPECVFAVLADGWLYASWVVGASHIRDVDDGWPAAPRHGRCPRGGRGWDPDVRARQGYRRADGIYFLDRADLPAIQRVPSRHFTAGTAPTSALIQVPGLVVPALLVELVPLAVVPHSRFRRPRS